MNFEIEINERYAHVSNPHFVIAGGYGNGPVDIYACLDCGVLVFDRSPHDFMHDEWAESTSMVYHKSNVK